ncbi:hypothetical protein [Capnocytophaga leadbetteri]|uniref:hypothetical protein n=1 Tax=Capnocytophaga leadbetteri TaxID=327575 RepID=UPI0028D79F5F|nr:hypothetical protein [Capnocytophaga leadbetteri]
MWYFLISNSDSYIEIQGSYDRVRNIFFSNQREPIENLELTAIAQEGLTKEILLEVDYLEDVIMGSIPVFSARFKEVIQPHLNGEMDLMPYFKDNEKGGKHSQDDYYKRRVASEEDVKSLIWLTKIIIEK